MPPSQDRNFEVRFENLTRSLTEAQLKKAPTSLLSKLLLCEDRGDDLCSEGPLVIPSKASSPACAAWQDGTPELFQVALTIWQATCVDEHVSCLGLTLPQREQACLLLKI